MILLRGSRYFGRLAKDVRVVTVTTAAAAEDGLDAVIKKIRDKFRTHANLFMATVGYFD